jgi:hypothetical protein
MIATCRRGCHSVAKGQWVRHLGPRIQGSGAQGRCASRASDKRPFHRTPVPAGGLGAIISADSPARVAHRVLAHFSHSRGLYGHLAADPRRHECRARLRNRRAPCWSPTAGRSRSLAAIRFGCNTSAESRRRPRLAGVALGLAQSPKCESGRGRRRSGRRSAAQPRRCLGVSGDLAPFVCAPAYLCRPFVSRCGRLSLVVLVWGVPGGAWAR